MRWKREVLATAGCLPVILCALLQPAGHAQAFDYVQNASFEQGTTGWLTVGDGTLVTVDATAVPPADGLHAAELTLEGPAFTVRQPVVSNVPPGVYHFNAAVRLDNPSTRVFARVSTISASMTFHEEYAPSAANLWENISFDLDVPETSDVKVEVGAQGTAGDAVYVDAVHFEGAPPATATPTVAAASVDATLTPERTLTTPTRTPAHTRTPAPTRTPTVDASPLIGSDLINGSFEDLNESGEPAVWHRYGGALSTDSSRPRTGSRAARFESSTASTKWIYQTLAVDPDSAYAFSAWLYDTDAGVSAAFLRVSWYASADGSGSALGSADSTTTLGAADPSYRRLTTGPIAPSRGARSAKVRVMLSPVSDAPAMIYIDDASFEPASLEDAVLASSRAAAAGVPAGAGPGDASVATRGSKSKRGVSIAGPDGSFAVSAAGVVINEVLYDPDNGGADASGEWVELYNAGSDVVDLKDWSLTDNGGHDAMPAYRLEPRGFVVIGASDSVRTSAPDLGTRLIVLGGRIGSSLGNSGDRLTLKDASGAVSDAISWGSDSTILDPAIEDVPAGHSIERRIAGDDTDSADDFVDNVRPSPGRGYDPLSANPEDAGAATGALAPAGGATGTWLPWGAAGAAGAALACVAGWQALPFVRRRLPHFR